MLRWGVLTVVKSNRNKRLEDVDDEEAQLSYAMGHDPVRIVFLIRQDSAGRELT